MKISFENQMVFVAINATNIENYEDFLQNFIEID